MNIEREIEALGQMTVGALKAPLRRGLRRAVAVGQQTALGATDRLAPAGQSRRRLITPATPPRSRDGMRVHRSRYLRNRSSGSWWSRFAASASERSSWNWRN